MNLGVGAIGGGDALDSAYFDSEGICPLDDLPELFRTSAMRSFFVPVSHRSPRASARDSEKRCTRSKRTD